MSEVKAGMRVRIELEIVVPADASREQVEAWVRYTTNCTGTLSGDNPLADYDLTGKGPVYLSEAS